MWEACTYVCGLQGVSATTDKNSLCVFSVLAFTIETNYEFTKNLKLLGRKENSRVGYILKST